MKLTTFELEAERQSRFKEKKHALYGEGKITPEQMREILKSIEPEMEALRNFEYEE